MLPHHQLVLFQIVHVIERRLGEELEQEPPNVGVEKTFGDVVRILFVIDMLVMAPMFARPHHDRIFKGGRAKKEDEEFDRKPGAKREMRK
jgi:hypothetical protein